MSESTRMISEEENKRTIKRDFYDWVASLAAAVLIITLTFTFVVRMMGVIGSSMYPTLVNGDRVIVLNSLLCGEYRRGEIVIARKESFSKDPIVKRVIATQGQTVDIDFETGEVKVDGEVLQEDYINDLTHLYEGITFPLTVPEGCVFVMGDNRNHSTDSRYTGIGPLSTKELIGKVKFVLIPGRDDITNKRDFGRIGVVK